MVLRLIPIVEALFCPQRQIRSFFSNEKIATSCFISWLNLQFAQPLKHLSSCDFELSFC